MNSLFVHMIQFFMLFLDIKFISYNDQFSMEAPHSWEVLTVRFLASMFMHIIVEKDIINGL